MFGFLFPAVFFFLGNFFAQKFIALPVHIQRLDIARDNIVNVSVLDDPPFLEVQPSFAQLLGGSEIVRYKNDGLPPPLEFQDFVKTLDSKIVVPHGQAVVDEKDLRVHVNSQTERETDVHSLGVAADGNVDELPDVGKCHDLFQLGNDLLAAEIVKAGIEKQVVPARELGVKSRAKVQKAGHAAVRLDFSLLRPEKPGHKSQQGGFPRSVGPDDRERFAIFYRERDPLERLKTFVKGLPFRFNFQIILFVNVFKFDGEIFGHARSVSGNYFFVYRKRRTRRPWIRPRAPQPGKRPFRHRRRQARHSGTG